MKIPRPSLDMMANNWALKLASVAVAFLLWSVVKAEEFETVTLTDVSVRVTNRDSDWVVAGSPSPEVVEIHFSGPTRELLRFTMNPPEVIIPVESVADSVEVRVLRAGWVQMYAGMDNTRVEDIRPSTVRLRFDRLVSRLVPVTVEIIGAPAEGYRLASAVQVEPSVVRAAGRATRLAEIDTLRLGPIDLSGWTATDSFAIGVDTAGLGLMVAPMQVRVVVPVEPVPDSLQTRTDSVRRASDQQDR